MIHPTIGFGGTVTPNTSKGWSSSVGLITGQSSPASIQANFPDAEYKTIQFGVVPPDDGKSTSSVFDATAFISWSVEGNTVTRLISIGNGVSISAPAQAYNITITDKTPNLGGTQVLGKPYSITVNITPGSRPNSITPPIFKPVARAIVLAPAGSTAQFIPAGAVAVMITAYDAVAFTNGNVTIDQITAGNALFMEYSALNQFMPLAGNAQQIRVTNQGANNVNVAFIFAIDG